MGKVHWPNLIYIATVHLGALYGASLTSVASWSTIGIAFFLYVLSCQGITAGAHRLWAHCTYSTCLPVEIVLMLCCSMANEGSILRWARDHRMHHKHVDTPLDPHDATRGVFYSHMGWLFTQKNKVFQDAGKNLYMEDLLANPVIRFQHRNHLTLSILMCFALPTFLTTLIGGTSQTWPGFWVAGMLRYCLVLHGTWSVNSLAHLWGTRPYIPHILPCENLLVSIVAMGEGWHNFHHAYPYDYSANEHGWYQWNPTTLTLDILAIFGLVYDRRTKATSTHREDSDLPRFTMTKVRTSVDQAAHLLVIDGGVYDVSTFLRLHPGGASIIRTHLGEDISTTFRQGALHAHTTVAYTLLKEYKVGILHQ
jgi:stearoyl-CoA desaturase (delta-9 desaturase)